MKAMVLQRQRESLGAVELSCPVPGDGEVLLRVRACVVWRTDLHVLDGDLVHPKLPLVQGHEIAGVVEDAGRGAQRWRRGERVGVPWLGWTCGECEICRAGRENLCERARFTGYQIDGGYAEYAVADARYCFAIPEGYDDVHAAPLLRARAAGAGRSGEGGHRPVRRYPHERHPELSVYAALGERVLRSVANLTRRDGEEFFRAATQAKLRTDVEVTPLAQANAALDALKAGRVPKTAVLVP